MNDTDKDGVPDYLDFENNSVAGAMVDTKGKMIDINNNGVPDDIEKYFLKNLENKGSPEKIEVKNAYEKSAVTFFNRLLNLAKLI